MNPGGPAVDQRPADGLLVMLQQVCEQAVQSLPVVQGAGVIVRFHGVPFAAAQTAPWVRDLDEGECEYGAGPGLLALHSQGAVSVSRGQRLARWPVLARAAKHTGALAVHAEPLLVDRRPIGVLTLYSTMVAVIDPAPGWLHPVTDALTAVLAGYCAAHPHEDHAVRLRRALHNRDLIGHAIGILMIRHGVNADQARHLLTAQASKRNTTPTTIARAIIRRHQASVPTTTMATPLLPVAGGSRADHG
jgi:hypothetical protein